MNLLCGSYCNQYLQEHHAANLQSRVLVHSHIVQEFLIHVLDGLNMELMFACELGGCETTTQELEPGHILMKIFGWASTILYSRTLP